MYVPVDTKATNDRSYWVRYIKGSLIQQGLTLTNIAEEVGYSLAHVSHILTGTGGKRNEKIEEALCRRAGVPVHGRCVLFPPRPKEARGNER
jgi:hypothetical protein